MKSEKTPYKTDPDDITSVYINDELSIARHIVCAANLVDGVIVCGARHHDKVMQAVYERLGVDGAKFCGREQQGFIDQYGQFVTREDAAIIVQINEQNLRDEIETDTCFSENLY